MPVRLAAKMNALGLLQISCVGTDPQTPQSWPLEFNLRPHEQGGAAARGAPAPAPVAPNATTEAQQAARDHIATLFTRPPPKSDRLTANAVLKTLERMIGLPRQEWNAALLRNLWPALNEQIMGRKLSVEHEEAWLTLAGFLLRPGFGFAHDGLRMDELWRLRDAGLCFPGKRSKVQEYILWRRVAGGLTAERQERLLAGELATIRAGKASPELVRLAGSLERLPRETKAELIETFIAQALRLVEAKQHCAPYLAALGLLLNRAPLYAGPETVVVAEFVARAYAAFQDFDWAEPELMECCNLFLRAARVVNDRNLDVPKSLRNQIARKLESAGIASIRTASIKGFTPVGRHRPHDPVWRAAASRPGARRRPKLKTTLASKPWAPGHVHESGSRFGCGSRTRAPAAGEAIDGGFERREIGASSDRRGLRTPTSKITMARCLMSLRMKPVARPQQPSAHSAPNQRQPVAIVIE